MKISIALKTVTLVLAFLSSIAYSRPIACPHYVLGEKLDLVNPEAGFEYPTERPPFAHLANYNVLKIGEGVRILIDNDLDLHCGILSDNIDFFLPIDVEQAIAGLDFPTDGPAHMDRDFLVWVLDNDLRVRLNDIKKITRAVAGIDFPTDGPANLDRDFRVMILRDGTRIALR